MHESAVLRSLSLSFHAATVVTLAAGKSGAQALQDAAARPAPPHGRTSAHARIEEPPMLSSLTSAVSLVQAMALTGYLRVAFQFAARSRQADPARGVLAL